MKLAFTACLGCVPGRLAPVLSSRLCILIHHQCQVKIAGSSLPRENREKGQKELPVRENTEHLENLPEHRKTTGNFVILKIKAIVIFAAKFQ